MKLLIVLLMLISSLQAVDLNWEHNYYKAIEQAKKENKDVYLFVGADKCRWCDRFKEMTLSDKDVIKTLKKDYILLYMSRDRHDIPSKFEVRGVPRHYFLTNKDKLIYKTQGSREIDGFYSLLEEVDLAKED